MSSRSFASRRPTRYGAAAQHRGIRSYVWSWRQGLESLLLVAVFWLLLAFSYDAVQQFWQHSLAWAWPRLGLGGSDQVQLGSGSLWGLKLQLVQVSLPTPLPLLWQWWLSAVCALALLAGSFLLSRERLPLIYLMRAVALLWLTGLLLHQFFTGVSNLSLAPMLSDLLRIGSAMLWLMPPLHALVLYIFPLPLAIKAGATLVALVFVLISVPLQVAALGWIVSTGSSLSLLLAYMLGTFLPHIAAQLGIYGYFVSLARVPH